MANGVLGLLIPLATRHPIRVLVGFGVLALVCAYGATSLTQSSALDHLLVDGDPERVRNHEIKAEFSNDELLVVALDLGHPFGEADLRQLRSVSEQLAEIPGIEEVIDLSNVEDVRLGGPDGDSLDASPLIDWNGFDARALPALRQRIEEHPLYRGNLVSDEGDVFGLVLILELAEEGHSHNPAVTGAVMDALGARFPDGGYYVMGYPAADYEAGRMLERDMIRLCVAAFFVIAGLLTLLLRAAFALGLYLMLVVWAELATFGWYGYTGTPLTVVTSMLPPVVLAIASTYCVYLLGMLREASDSPAPAVRLIQLAARPILLSGLSTAIGFLSLRLLPVSTIGDLGTGLAFGTMACVVASMLLVPALVARFGWRLEHEPRERTARFLTLGVRLARRPVLTTTVFLTVLAIPVFALPRLQLDSDPTNYWRPDSFHRRSDVFIREHLSGTLPINAIIETHEPGGALRPDVLRFAERVARFGEAQPEVDLDLSLLDYLDLIDVAIRPDGRGPGPLEAPGVAAQYLLLYEAGGDADDLRHYVSYDRSALNVFMRIHTRSSAEVLALRDRVAALAAEAPEGVTLEVLGTWFLFPKAMDAITRSMVTGLATAVALITVVMILVMRSPRIGLLAMIPNAAPILCALGLLAWSGWPLSFATSIVGCVAVGLAVDDTAHVLGHIEGTKNLDAVYRRVGWPLVATTVLLTAGFSCLMLSEFAPVVHLGAATAFTLLLALACDLLLLPSLLVIGRVARVEPGSEG